MSATMRCECGAPAIDTERRWNVRADADGDPESCGDGRDYPVCYGMGRKRYDARDYCEHVLRLAVAAGDPDTIAVIERKRDARTLATSPREEVRS